MQKEGTLTRIIFNNAGNGYTVAVLDTDEGAVRIAGSIAEPKEGARYRLEGKFTIHPKYGEQFSFTGYEELVPEGEDAIFEFLAAGNIRGIGPKMARTIVDAFGAETLDIIEKTARTIVNTADCAIGRDAARLVVDGLEGFRDDYEEHIKHHRCLAGLQMPVPCVALCPAGVDIPATN